MTASHTHTLQRRKTLLDEPEEDACDPRMEHESLLHRDGRAALSLRCRGRQSSPREQPLFFTGDTIEGGVQLMMPKNTYFDEVTLTARGRIQPTRVGQSGIFWTTSKILWSAPNRAEKSSSSSAGGLIGRMTSQSGKLPVGNYSFPFKLPLPLEIEVRTGAGGRRYPLPPTFRGEQGPGLEYELVVCASRGVLREPYELVVPFVYLPRSFSEYPMRRSPSPSHSAEQSLVLSGTAFGDRPVTFNIRTFIRPPLIYAGDDAIWVTILLESSDPQALDLLASPQYVSLQLEQRVTVGDQAWYETLSEGQCGRSPSQPAQKRRAVGQRLLEGHVVCPKRPAPTFEFAAFAVEHCVRVDIRSNGFFVPSVSSSRARTELLHPVRLVMDRDLCRPSAVLD